ncbi:PIN domain-containing protein [uncultured Thiodictyon sp.]|uniref:PIN domain-containing protein n=1 Tax=uncultured Thiodictyon sp. TaxID=1846217 RepID=UPI0025EA27F3|nr:PIN domain-containing protein [uncultured Thiodictyon sp.]
MTRRRTYLDANVLIAAWNGDDESRAWARAVLDDPERHFLTSDFVRLEVLPKPGYCRRPVEVAFMQAILSIAEDVPVTGAVAQHALVLAARHDIAPLDALHLAAAAAGAADEVVTFERPEKPMCRQTEISVISLRAIRDEAHVGGAD